MKAVVQRVKSARVMVNNEIKGIINGGLLVYIGISNKDTIDDVDYMADKISNLRIFNDDMGKMNLSLLDIENGQMLVVSQFTLYGDCRKGRRPNFTKAGSPEIAEEYYNIFIETIRGYGIDVQTGVFQAHMEVESINDGPVTILIDAKKEF